MNKLLTLLVLAGMSGLAGAKLPPLSDEAKAKAAEAAAKTAWGDKVGAYQLCVAMDKVAARYLADAAKAGKTLQPTATPPCSDPGPFAYAPPAPAKPLEHRAALAAISRIGLGTRGLAAVGIGGLRAQAHQIEHVDRTRPVVGPELRKDFPGRIDMAHAVLL